MICGKMAPYMSQRLTCLPELLFHPELPFHHHHAHGPRTLTGQVWFKAG
jgi:hypothetical protein